MRIDFVLVRPARPENVGAAARALKTMGFSSLALVASQVQLEPAARWLAHGAGDILDAAVRYPDLRSALAGADFAVATTARRRVARFEYLDGAALGGFLSERQSDLGRVALVFGGEESGLSNDELKECDLVSTIPMAVDYPSLNLGQAVMLYAYLLSALAREAEPPAGTESAPPASWRALRPKLERLLELAGIQAGSNRASRILERSVLLGLDDLRLAHSITNGILDRFG